MSRVVFLLLLFVALPGRLTPAETAPSPPRDAQTKSNFASIILSQVKTGQFDVLEGEYQDFRDRQHQTLPDGTPKSWVFFWAFEAACLNSDLAEDANFMAKLKQWLAAHPFSVPAMLAFDNALLGQCEHIRREAIVNHTDIHAPELIRQLQGRADEITTLMEHVPGDRLPALYTEPECSSVNMHLYTLANATYDQFKTVCEDIQRSDSFYVPFYCQALVWLSIRRKDDSSLPRGEVWLTDHFRLNGLESDEEAKKKSETYAQVVAFASPDKVHFDPNLMNWPLLKAGLQNLVQDFGKDADWPSRLLLASFQMKDRDTCQAAFEVVAGNPSPEVISKTTYDQIAKWLSQG